MFIVKCSSILLALFLGSVASLGAHATECPESSYTLTSQDEVAALGSQNCSAINGSLIVRESEAGAITSLDPLTNILRVGASLVITGNSSLTNLDGLVNIKQIGANDDTSPTYYPVGPQTNIDYSRVTNGGWELCHQSQYNNSYFQSNIEGDCSVGLDTTLMMACRQTGSSEIKLLAAASASDVLNATSGRYSTHEANGTSWYHYEGYSSGFAREGDGVNLNSADYITSGANDQRLSWHWNSTGYRCGEYRWGSDSRLERLVFRSGPVAGSLVINDNASLRDIEGLRSLTAIAGSVEITDNEL